MHRAEVLADASQAQERGLVVTRRADGAGTFLGCRRGVRGILPAVEERASWPGRQLRGPTTTRS
jgi:hypothetical protein